MHVLNTPPDGLDSRFVIIPDGLTFRRTVKAANSETAVSTIPLEIDGESNFTFQQVSEPLPEKVYWLPIKQFAYVREHLEPIYVLAPVTIQQREDKRFYMPIENLIIAPYLVFTGDGASTSYNLLVDPGQPYFLGDRPLYELSDKDIAVQPGSQIYLGNNLSAELAKASFAQSVSSQLRGI